MGKMILRCKRCFRQNPILKEFGVPRGTNSKGDEKMKQNTKFLWMYVGILFSFALILIIFAGFSRNSENEQTMGLQADVATLSQKNTALQAENTKLFARIDELIASSDAQGIKIKELEDAEKVLSDAYSLYVSGKRKDARELTTALNYENLSATQKIVYDIIN